MRVPASVASLLLVSSLAVFSILGAGCKGDRDKCTRAAQHFAELVFWDRENVKIAQLPPEQRDATRKQRLVDFQRELDAQLEFRIQQCVAANNDDQADCINKAKTAAEALACAEIAKSE